MLFLNLSHLEAKASMELLCSLSGSFLPLLMFTPDANCNFNVSANNFNFNVRVNLHHLKLRIPARFCCQHASGRENPEEVQVHQVDFSPLMDYSYKLLFVHLRDYFFSPEQFCHETHDTSIEPVVFLGLPPLRCGSDPFLTWPTIFIIDRKRK